MLLKSTTLHKLPLLLAMTLGVYLIWQTPYLPMLDLPQHVGQIAVLHDLLFASHPFAAELKLNFFTPYLLFYVPAALLSLLVSPLVAAKILLTVSLLGWLYAGRLWLRHFGSDTFLLWLFIPVFFSFCYLAGFLTFLLAAPLVLLVLISADRYSSAPNMRGLLLLTLLLVGLFFCHGLAFYFAYFLTGLLWLARHFRRPIALLRGGIPLLLAAVPAGLHLYISLVQDPALHEPGPIRFYTIGERALNYLLYQTAFPAPSVVWFSCALILAPFLLGQIRNAHSGAKIIFAGFILLWLTLPYNPAHVSFVFDRYSLYLLPFMAALLPARAAMPYLTSITKVLLALSVFMILGHQAQVQANFAKQTAPYIQALKDLPAGQRVLNLVTRSELDEMIDVTNWHLASWYQSERQGWVEFNFANFEPQIVRYRDKHQPVYYTRMSQLEKFNWQTYQANRFNFISVRHAKPLPDSLFASAPCTVSPWRAGDGWSIFAVENCSEN